MSDEVNNLCNERIKICDEIQKLKDSKYKRELFMKLDSLDHVLECSLNNYKFMRDFAKEHKFDVVVDIGCAYGHQNELFKDFSYIGIDDCNNDFYRKDEKNVHYLVGQYPFEIPELAMIKRALAISNMCIGWECYKYNEDEFEKQFEALSKDFKASLIYMPYGRISTLEKYFKNIEIHNEKNNGGISIHTAYFYCWN